MLLHVYSADHNFTACATQFPRKYGCSNYATRQYFLEISSPRRKDCRYTLVSLISVSAVPITAKRYHARSQLISIGPREQRMVEASRLIAQHYLPVGVRVEYAQTRADEVDDYAH